MSNYPPAPNPGFQPPYQQPPYGPPNFSQPPNPYPAQPVKKSKTWLIVLIVVGVSLVAIVGMCVVAGLVFELTKKELPVQPRDREVVLDIQRLETFVDDYQSNPKHETIAKHRYMDDSHEVAYEYEDPGDEGIYLICTVTVENNVSDAGTTFLAESKGTELGTAISDVDIVDRDDVFRWGDKSRFALIKADNLPVGNFFVARKGTRVFSVVFGGVYFDDGDSVSELLMPVLSKLESYQP